MILLCEHPVSTGCESAQASCEKLRREERLFQSRGDAYANAPDPEQVFAERAESIIAGENALWLDLEKKPGSAVR